MPRVTRKVRTSSCSRRTSPKCSLIPSPSMRRSEPSCGSRVRRFVPGNNAPDGAAKPYDRARAAHYPLFAPNSVIPSVARDLDGSETCRPHTEVPRYARDDTSTHTLPPLLRKLKIEKARPARPLFSIFNSQSSILPRSTAEQPQPPIEPPHTPPQPTAARSSLPTRARPTRSGAGSRIRRSRRSYRRRRNRSR
jgi:hypothetical protein